MEFYQTLSKYYDDIFPPGAAQIAMLKNAFSGKRKLLDLACGTGNYALALAENGYQIYGLDLDKSMINEAKKKNTGERVVFIEGNMRDCEAMFGHESFDGIYCIGNSLVHLTSKEEVSKLIHSVYKLLKDGGVFISQIVNYDRVLHYKMAELPPLNNEQAGVKFRRKYQYRSQQNSIVFTGIIELNNSTVLTTSVELLPLVRNELVNYHGEAGFSSVACYGDFKYSPYSLDSEALVILAQK